MKPERPFEASKSLAIARSGGKGAFSLNVGNITFKVVSDRGVMYKDIVPFDLKRFSS